MWGILILVALIAAFVVLYNSLVRLRIRADNAWSDIDVQLKRRADLVPNLVETVKGYATHERETLERVIAARDSAVAAQGEGPQTRAAAEGMLTGALRQLFALAEAYPDLQASSSFRDLQSTLQSLEQDIASARRYYNAVVRDFNTRIHTIPSNVVATAFGFREREFYEAEEGDRALPRVRF